MTDTETRLATLEAESRIWQRDVKAMQDDIKACSLGVQRIEITLAAQSAVRQTSADHTARAISAISLLAAAAAAVGQWVHVHG